MNEEDKLNNKVDAIEEKLTPNDEISTEVLTAQNVSNNTGVEDKVIANQPSIAPTEKKKKIDNSSSLPEEQLTNDNTSNIQIDNNLKINPDIKIGELKPVKRSVLPVIIIFVVIIGCCFGLPYLYDAVNSYFNSSNNSNIPNNPTNNHDDNEDEPNDEEENIEPEEFKLVMLSPETEIKYQNLTFNNLSLVTENDINYINYTIINNSPSNIDINNLYIELYNDDKTLLGRALIENQNIAVGNNVNLKSEITSDVKNNTTQILIIEKDEQDFPTIELTNNTLTCTKGINQIIYTFLNNKLTNINDIYNYVTTDSNNYESDSLEYKNKLNSYLTYGGTTSFVENPSGFTASINLNLKDIDEEAINTNHNYYKYETNANKIKFQQESKAFICH